MKFQNKCGIFAIHSSSEICIFLQKPTMSNTVLIIRFLFCSHEYIQIVNKTQTVLEVPICQVCLMSEILRMLFFVCYWLLLQGGITQSVPCTATIFWSIESHLSYNNFWFIRQRSLEITFRGELGEKWQWILPMKYLFHIPHGSLTCHQDEANGSLFPIWRKSCYRFLMPLKIHHPRLGFNPRLLGPMASTITSRPLRATSLYVTSLILVSIQLFLAYFQKMKVGLSNHQPVCLYVCPPLITFEPIGGCSWNLVGRCCHSRWPWHHMVWDCLIVVGLLLLGVFDCWDIFS
jgi:hypothetical protein